MQIGKTPGSKSPSVLRPEPGSTGAANGKAAGATRASSLSGQDRAVISSPAREKFLEVKRFADAARELEVGRSKADLDALKSALANGDYDTPEAVQEAFEKLLSGL